MPRINVVCPSCGQVRELTKRDAGELKNGGLCFKCSMNAKRGENNPNWKGGRIKDVRGYIQIMLPSHSSANAQGYIRESRLVMEQVLGRPLLPNEIVHHINGIKDNNRPENLSLFRSTNEHSSHHREKTPRDAYGRFIKK